MRIDRKGFTEIAHLVGETDFERVPAIVDVLHHLCSFQVGAHQRRLDAFVKPSQSISTLRINFADHRLRRKIKALHRRTLAEEFGVVANSETDACFFP